MRDVVIDTYLASAVSEASGAVHSLRVTGQLSHPAIEREMASLLVLYGTGQVSPVSHA